MIQKQFGRSVFGYNKRAVDEYLDDLTLESNILLREKDKEISHLKAENTRLSVDVISTRNEIEKSIESAKKNLAHEHSSNVDQLSAENERLAYQLATAQENLANKTDIFENEKQELLIEMDRLKMQHNSFGIQPNDSYQVIEEQKLKLNQIQLELDRYQQQVISLTAENDQLKNQYMNQEKVQIDRANIGISTAIEEARRDYSAKEKKYLDEISYLKQQLFSVTAKLQREEDRRLAHLSSLQDMPNYAKNSLDESFQTPTIIRPVQNQQSYEGNLIAQLITALVDISGQNSEKARVKADNHQRLEEVQKMMLENQKIIDELSAANAQKIKENVALTEEINRIRIGRAEIVDIITEAKRHAALIEEKAQKTAEQIIDVAIEEADKVRRKGNIKAI